MLPLASVAVTTTAACAPRPCRRHVAARGRARMLAQPAPLLLQSCHCRCSSAGIAVQVPVVAVRVCPCCAVPETAAAPC